MLGEKLAFAAYNTGLGLAGVAALPALPWLLSRPAGRGIARRFGYLPPDIASLCGRAPIWVHAASVGEVLAAEPLVSLLKRHEPEHAVFVTTTSLSGRQTARTQLGVPATLLPADLSWVVWRVLRQVRPAALVILETELWPNLFRAAGRLRIPVLLVSARLSTRAAAGYAWMRPIMRAALRNISAVAAQTDGDAERLIALGAPADRVQVLGSIKFARQAAAPNAEASLSFGSRPVLVAASTQPGEEEVVIEACREVWQDQPSMLLVLAPRRPERFDAVASMLASLGIATLRRSAAGESIPDEVKVLLLDTLGELAGFFSSARAAFVGGTLAALGGHNVLEPAAFAVPVCFGPHIENVREAADALLRVGAAEQVRGSPDLAAAWKRILADPAAARAMGQRARQELDKRAAVASKALALVQACLRRER